jgi:hypothetical protein
MGSPPAAYVVSHYDPATVSTLADTMAALLSVNLAGRRPGDRSIQRIRRPIGLRSRDDGTTATIVFGTHQIVISNALINQPPVLIEGGSDELAALLRLQRRGALLPIGLATRDGARVLTAIATRRLTVRGLLRHPLTIVCFLAVASLRPVSALNGFCGAPRGYPDSRF